MLKDRLSKTKRSATWTRWNKTFFLRIGGFHVTSSLPYLWTKTNDLSLAHFFRPPSIVHYLIVFCISRDWLQTIYLLGIVHTYPGICENANFFFYEYGLRPHVSSVFSGRIRKFLKTLSRVEFFLSDTNTYTCGRSYPEICEYAYVILLDPGFTASIKQKWRTATLCLLC